MPKSCIMFVWKIKFYSCVVRLLSYWVHCWNLIFQHKAHYVFRNPSWCHTFHFDVNFSLLSFVSRLHFAINVLTVNPFVMCGCVYQRFVRLDSQHPLNESLSHTLEGKTLSALLSSIVGDFDVLGNKWIASVFCASKKASSCKFSDNF